MAYSKRFSKDPKVDLISLEEFYQNYDYLCGITKDDLWETTIEPGAGSLLFKFTPQYLISTFYDFSFTNYGMDVGEKLAYIYM